MGSLTRIALLCLGLTGLSLALECHVGSATVSEDGKIVESSVETQHCYGLCTRRSPKMPDGSVVHFFGCEERDRMFDVDDVCTEDMCNSIPGVKAVAVQAAAPIDENELPVNDFTCYVGIQLGSYTAAGAVASCSQAGTTGSCASASTYINGVPATLFFCTTHAVCDAFIDPSPPDGQLICSGVKAHPDYNITACCCYSGSNCNTGNYTLPTPLPSLTPQTNRIPQACYSGIHIAGQLLAGGSYVACQGDCSSVSFKYMGMYDFSMYSCEPANLCQQLNIQNNCLDIGNGTLAGCCCNSDACIDPTVTPPRYPNGTRTPIIECYAGVHITNTTSMISFDVGASLACDGMCGRLKTTTGGYMIESFFCASYNLCYAVDSVGSCSNLTFAGMGVETCCCWDSPNCNTNNTDITPVPATQIPRRDVIACFQGLHVNNVSIAESYTSCAGDCASLTVSSSFNGMQYNTTLFTCDPTSVCSGMNIINRCAQIAGSPISGCCCDTDVCINPYARKYPNGTTTLKCGAGLIVPAYNYTDLYEVDCPGTCASVDTTVSGVLFAGFFCAPSSMCKALDLRNDCQTIGNASAGGINTCCCDYMNDCNAERFRIRPIPFTPPTDRPPIACWGGLAINNNFFMESGRYMACKGDCGMMTFRTSINGADTNVTMYSCDPVAVCPRMGLQNSCTNSTTGVFSGCCCDWNDCIDIQNRKINPYPLPYSINCFVGLAWDLGNGTTLTVGGQGTCNGQCGTLVTDINGIHTYGYYCAPQSVCSAWDVWQGCSRSWLDMGGDWVDVCCCNNADNCNIARQQPNYTVPTPTPSRRRAPISCYSGLAFRFNGTDYPLSDEDQYQSCFGDCAQVTYISRAAGADFQATMFSCDPVSVCQTLGMANSCANITQTNGIGISGCCCNYDDCINKRNGTINPPRVKDNLQCFVGLQLQSNPMNASSRYIQGSSMSCAGECGTVNTHFNGFDMWAFICTPPPLCNAFDPERMCGNPLNLDPAGDYLQVCCCAGRDNCNLYGHGFPVPSPIPTVDPTTEPKACYYGVAMNGKVLTEDNRFMSCQGDCASVTYASRVGGNVFEATIFTCDPVALCNTFNVSNSCTLMQNGQSNDTRIRACCCGWNDCINRADNSSFSPLPVPHWHKDDLNCFVGMSFLGNNGTTNLGGSMPCNGDCMSVETTMNRVQTIAFFCGTDTTCDIIDPTRGCSVRFLDRTGDYLKTCCCGDSDNCASNRYGVNPGSPVNTTGVQVLGCLAGVKWNGNSSAQYVGCQGDCASLTFSSVLGGSPFNLTMFMCDPVSLCASLGMQNRCHRIGSGTDNTTAIRGCCCQWNDCIDPDMMQIRPYPLPSSANCFTGLSFSNGSSVTTLGGTMPCDGQCGSLVTNVNGVQTYGYYCAPQALCSQFEIWNECTRRYLDSGGDAIDICCCMSGDNCNIMQLQPNVTVPTVKPPAYPPFPLACYSGLTFNFNGTFYNMTSSDRYSSCMGNCAAIQYQSTAAGAAFAATVYTCDPVSLCSSLGMSNTCVNITGTTGNGIAGCCCEWNDCIDLKRLRINPYPIPASPNCFTGMTFVNTTSGSMTTLGGTMRCDGQCGSLVTTVNGIKTYGFYCAPQALCSQFEIWDECTTRNLDANDTVDICCCNWGDNCNVRLVLGRNATIPTAAPPAVAPPPLACYSGLTFNLNGTFYNMTSSDRYSGCLGNCASIQYGSSVAGSPFLATVFTCDPVSLCSSLGLNNRCTNVTGTTGNGIAGCCCNWNDCIDIKTGVNLRNAPVATTTTLPPATTTKLSSPTAYLIATIVAMFVSFF